MESCRWPRFANSAYVDSSQFGLLAKRRHEAFGLLIRIAGIPMQLHRVQPLWRDLGLVFGNYVMSKAGLYRMHLNREKVSRSVWSIGVEGAQEPLALATLYSMDLTLI
jgi:hypothetical protein